MVSFYGPHEYTVVMIRLTTIHSKRRIYLALKDLLSNHSDGKVLTSMAKVIKRAEIVNFYVTCFSV